MSVKTFNLPDLGEGLPEAEIVSWLVAEGDMVNVDQPMLSVETAKAVVEVPAPYTGRIAKIHAPDGTILPTHSPLVDIDTSVDTTDAAASGSVSGSAESTAAKVDTPAEPAKPAATADEDRADSGTVVGKMMSSDDVLEDADIAGRGRRRTAGKIKAAPAVRALARELGVKLEDCRPTGRHERIVADDVRAAAASTSPPAPRQAPRVKLPPGEPERLRGPRRAMAQSMSAARDLVSQCTIFDDADIHHWVPGQDITARLLRAIAVACRAEPALNGFYDGENMSRQLESRVDIAIAVDTPEGLIVPVVRDVGQKSPQELRADLNAIKTATRERSVKPEDMRDFTFTLSNFGMMAGRYATPVVVPPTIAILGAGGLRHDIVAVMGGIETHRRIPLSLTFDHRCATGGEACRFLAAAIADLQKHE
ncbi:dihydrolipoamide acetyltransferase family protein [Wenzhouxiangella sp. XN24]|uniref:dihydrolipoamide acetyltransferase family protein n=1 Tax=Wenzhouxiangella sp. XN24 TaxID=2713569 RepID=UPI0013EA3728|nr:dihydrolipoamide acetyltransferase family protein [Wenzhouxiangella sp. XN24]NGX14886.1 2-oxo acid dehydrogenase subunit E2 [Wenzhouxiangella sp. XN24]